jgi:hypothetical protein
MNKPRLLETGEDLAAVLAQENEALARLDLARAAALYPLKAATAAAFSDAQERTTDSLTSRLDAEQQRLARELAERLRDLVEQNRRLLERGIHVQRNVVGTVARAMAQVAPSRQTPRYGATGTISDPRRPTPVVLSSRA